MVHGVYKPAVLDYGRCEQSVSFAKQFRTATGAVNNKIMRGVILVTFRTNCARQWRTVVYTRSSNHNVIWNGHSNSNSKRN